MLVMVPVPPLALKAIEYFLAVHDALTTALPAPIVNVYPSNAMELSSLGSAAASDVMVQLSNE